MQHQPPSPTGCKSLFLTVYLFFFFLLLLFNLSSFLLQRVQPDSNWKKKKRERRLLSSSEGLKTAAFQRKCPNRPMTGTNSNTLIDINRWMLLLFFLLLITLSFLHQQAQPNSDQANKFPARKAKRQQLFREMPKKIDVRDELQGSDDH